MAQLLDAHLKGFPIDVSLLKSWLNEELHTLYEAAVDTYGTEDLVVFLVPAKPEKATSIRVSIFRRDFVLNDPVAPEFVKESVATAATQYLTNESPVFAAAGGKAFWAVIALPNDERPITLAVGCPVMQQGGSS